MSNKTRAIEKKIHALQKNQDQQQDFSIKLNSMINELPDASLLMDRHGRKLITEQITLRFFRQHDLDWCTSIPVKRVLTEK